MAPNLFLLVGNGWMAAEADFDAEKRSHFLNQSSVVSRNVDFVS
jgi:hypothetical protein